MCVIISLEKDQSTDDVMSWIDYLGGEVERINITKDIEEKVLYFNLEADSLSKNIKKQKGWLRKNGMFRHLDCYKNLFVDESYDLGNYFYLELNALRRFFYLQNVEWINDPNVFTMSKIDVLKKAMKYDIEIPKTFVINRKFQLQKLFNDFNGEIITKSLTDVPQIKKNNEFYISLTTKISQEQIDLVPDSFFPTLIQNYIQKEFEIRCFYFKGHFFSAAIFSQNDSQTAIDFRNYNYSKPNRIVPYKLPKITEEKIDQLCKDCGITTGSIDLIKGIDGIFYFLEINQGGQFGMISRPCNFMIEKLIAENLAN